MTWILVVLAVATLLVAAFLLLPKPGRNIDRSEIHHWTKSLIRLYANGAYIQMNRRNGTESFRIVRSDGEDDTCHVLFQIPRAGCTAATAAAVREYLNDAGVSLNEADTTPTAIQIQTQVPNIYSDDAGATAVRRILDILDIFGVDRDARWDLEFHGERSIERTKEAYRQMRERGYRW